LYLVKQIKSHKKQSQNILCIKQWWTQFLASINFSIKYLHKHATFYFTYNPFLSLISNFRSNRFHEIKSRSSTPKRIPRQPNLSTEFRPSSSRKEWKVGWFDFFGTEVCLAHG
jgi:hypothetical protein